MSFDLIIFDLGDVIFLYNHHIISHKISLLESIPKENIHHILFHGGFYEPFDKGQVSAENFFNNVKNNLGLKMDFELFMPIWNDIFVENKPVSDLIIRLKKNKYKIYVLSNTNELHFNYLMKNFPIMKEIENFILSFEVGNSKPHPAIYRAALDKADVPAERTIFIDDYIEFAQGAMNLNIKGIQFKNEIELIKDLRSFGIDCN